MRCSDLKGYVDRLGPEDAVIIEACSGAFYWADRVESKGALCYVIDPHKFLIIRDSWNMVKALWVYILTGEFGIPITAVIPGVSDMVRKFN